MNLPLGISLSVFSSVLFGVLYYFSTFLHPLTGNEVFGWRMLLMSPFMTVYVCMSGDWRHIVTLIHRIRQRPAIVLGLCLSSVLLGVQQWLFLWAPMNGSALSVSLGYFILPLTMIGAGRLVYREKLSGLQKAAAIAAMIGAGHDVFRAGGLSWETALVAVGFPLYFILRKRLATDNAGGLWFDNLLALPIGALSIWIEGASMTKFGSAPHLYIAIPILAAMSATAFFCSIGASRLLPLGLFGLLGYVEPVLMFIASLMIGETVTPRDVLTYVPIVAALVILAADGVRHLPKPGKRPATRSDSSNSDWKQDQGNSWPQETGCVNTASSIA